MADHLDAPGLMSPGLDASIDITDNYAFQKPGDPNKTILMMNVNPLAPTLASAFNTDAVYQINVDNDGDAITDVSFRIRFTDAGDGSQLATVRRQTGSQAQGPGSGGAAVVKNAPVSGLDVTITKSEGYRFFAGIRSDPFFFDLLGFLAGFQFTGSDFFIDKNVFAIVLEVPNSSLGPDPHMGIWSRCTRPAIGPKTQIDRMGRPAINTVFNHSNDKNIFNGLTPDKDFATFGDSFIATFESFGYSTADATANAHLLLPDLLTYDYSSSAGFLNGRNLTDDVIDIELGLVTKGAITGDGVSAHTDLLSDFPYQGNPH